MSESRTLDVGSLPPGAFGSRSLMWWGTMGIVLIEGTVFALAIAAYFYFRTRMTAWPPDGVAPPDLLWGAVNTLVLLASLVPNELAKRAGEQVDLRRVRVWMAVCLVFGAAFNAIRVYEFRHLNVTWDHDAYGSAVWVLLGLHTFNLVTDVADTLVVCAVMFKKKIDGKRYVDVAANAGYWWFIIGSWIPIYAVVYLAPRL